MSEEKVMRDKGFYWVLSVDFWDVAWWDDATSLWFIAGESKGFRNEFWEEIDERRIVREDKQ